MMAEAMHDLPLIMCESSYNKKVFEVVALMMDEVVADANHPDQLKGSDSC
jgi:hypothetical protein